MDNNGVVFGLFNGLELRTLDPVTGTTTFIANVVGAERIEAITFDSDGTLYAAGSAGDDQNSENLYQIDVNSGMATLVGPTGFTDLDDLAFGSDGNLYGVDSNNGVEAMLLQISTTDGQAIDLGFTGVSAANGINNFTVDFLFGDVNEDGVVNLLDVAPFIDAFFMGTFTPSADTNFDGKLDLLDITPFIDILTCQ